VVPFSSPIAAYWFDPVWWIIVAAILLLLSLNVVRLSRKQRRRQLGPKTAWASAFYLMLGKLPQFLGLLQYRRNRFLARASQLIEYKDDPRRS
jgi:hypothetical protein